MENAAQKVRDWWEVADRTQRYVTVFGAAALIVLLVLTGYVMSRPKMTALYSGLTPTQQGPIVAELRKSGIPVEVSTGGTVSVPVNSQSEAEMVVANASLTPNSGPEGMSLLFGGSQSMLQTSKEEQERIIAAKEGELAKTIMTWQGVASAKVHWNIGSDSPFADEKTPGSASVSLVESGAGLSPSAGKAIARLVQNATGVEPENISVVNNLGRMLYDGKVLSDSSYGAGQKLAAEIQEGRRREADLARSLDVAFGAGNTIPMVQVELDMDTVNKNERKETPSDVPTDKTTVSETVNGNVGSGVAGSSGFTPNNNPAAQPDTQPTGQQGPGSYTGTQSQEHRPSDLVVTQTTKAPGSVIGMTVQILANKKSIKDLKTVQDFAASYLGAKYNQPGFTASVTAVEFDAKAMKDAETAAKSAASSMRMQQIISLLPVLALIVVGFFVIRAITKAAAKRNVFGLMALPTGGPAVALPQGQMPAVNPMLSQKAAASAAPSFIQYEGMHDMPSPQGSAGQKLATALGTGQIEDALRIIEEMPEDPEIKAIQARINVPLEQIKHMARTKPQAVSMLLKGWMMEDMR